MQSSSEGVAFSAAFERIAHTLRDERDFKDIEIVTTRASRSRAGWALFVMVDRRGGVDIATCERVAARINAALDGFSEFYTLEVESAGLNRPLIGPADYERFAGEDVRLISLLAIEGAKTHRGRLAGVRAGHVIIEMATGERAIPLEAVKSANIEFDIRADLQRAKRAKHEQKEQP